MMVSSIYFKTSNLNGTVVIKYLNKRVSLLENLVSKLRINVGTFCSF